MQLTLQHQATPPPAARPGAVVAEIAQRTSAVNLVSFSGGKDSTVVLQLVMAAQPAPPIFSGLRRRASTARGRRRSTGKLKIDPITRFTRQVTAGQDYTVFVGVRSAESELRARIYQSKDYKPRHFAPILDWSAHDVWEYLLTEPCPWGDHADLVKVYKYSSDECVYGEAQGVCVGNARYGCWACPLQKSTQLDMIGMHTGDDRYQDLKRFKSNLVGTANRTAYRSRIRRNGQVGAGPFLVKVRQRLFADLKAIEHRTGWPLITPEEEACIREHWAIDEQIHHVPDPTAPLLWQVT